MAINIQSLLKFVAPKKSAPGGVTTTSTFNPRNTTRTLTLPTYREHLSDIFTSRSANDSRELLKQLFQQDPDMSAAVSAFLTVANTEPVFLVKDLNGVIDRKGQEVLNQLIRAFTSRYDYSTGFELVPALRVISENMRFMVLLRGGVGAELLLNKQKLPYGIRIIDLAGIEWFERLPGSFKPQQTDSTGTKISLDVASFFVAFFHRNPTEIYVNSPFVSSINTIAARQQVINDLYRIMRFTGMPRIEITILEDVLRKSAPASISSDAAQMTTWIDQQIAAITATVSDMRADQAFVHTDSVSAGILNEKSPSNGMNIDSIINTLNAQNQAGLRAMSTILGRGESGVNTASVEARIFAMNAEELNTPVAEIWSQALTMSLRTLGYDQLFVECSFQPAEMRSALELEPQLIMKATRLRMDLSLGMITDDEYHLAMYGRIRPDTAPELSGTNFMDKSQAASVDVQDLSPNDDPMGRSVTAPGSKAAKGNIVPK